MKGILLAGGSGTRLAPMTSVISKQLLPIYDKPMIFYSLASLMRAGIRDILIISTPRDLPMIERLLGSGEWLGISLSYAVQPEPKGIAQALLIGEQFLAGQRCCLVLGDNIFYGEGLSRKCQELMKEEWGAVIFAYGVKDPERYGVIAFNDAGQAISIEEKPKNPKSHFAVTGMYFYDGEAADIARNLKPSERGELEITDVNRAYLQRGNLKVVPFGRGIAWLDTGTPDSMLSASTFVQTIEERQGFKIACIEEIAYNSGWITKADVEQIIAERYPHNEYGNYLRNILSPMYSGRYDEAVAI